MNKAQLGERIRVRRKQLAINQEDLAEIAGVSDRTLRDIEKGTANPELESLINILEALGFELTLELRNGQKSTGF